jgi:hypothetical protein
MTSRGISHDRSWMHERPYWPKPMRAFQLPLLGSNQDSPAPEAGVLPVTPRGITISADRDLPRPGERRILFVTRHPGNPEPLQLP